MSKTAVVVGGSIAGLMHAIMLQRHGYTITVLEQESTTSRQGVDAGIRVGAEMRRFLKKHDVTGRAYGISAPIAQVIDKNGRQRLKWQHDLILTSWALLIDILHANCNGIYIRHGARLLGISPHPCDDRIEVHWEDETKGLERLTPDLVIAADGANSSIRREIMPDTQRQYAGYVAWRGVVKEELICEEYRKVFEEKFTFFFMNDGYILVSIIPPDNGDFERGKRLLNWVWYVNLTASSAALKQTMTDIDGLVHHGTVPRGKVQPEAWEHQQSIGLSKMPICIAALIEHTQLPFVTKIYDAISTQAVLFNRDAFLVGDALVAFRPHIAESTNQAAYHCRLLDDMLDGKIENYQWEREVLRYGRRKMLWSRVVGTWGCGLRVQFLWSLYMFVWVLVGQKLRFL